MHRFYIYDRRINIEMSKCKRKRNIEALLENQVEVGEVNEQLLVCLAICLVCFSYWSGL